jgi:7SK snRNA methylphosphate capping enzyme
VPDNDVDLTNVVAEYDTIIAFSVTKWIHLNFGDQGLKRFFKRIYRTLLPGGRLLLEPQPWSSYRLKRRMTKDITETYNHIEFKPPEFVSYLLSAEVGFETCTTVAIPNNTHKGFQRSMFLFIKSSTILDN